MSVFREGNHLRDGWFVTFLLAGLLAGVVVIMAGVLYGPVRWSCRNTAQAMNVEWRWSITTDCLVLIDGEWVPLDSYRGTEDVDR